MLSLISYDIFALYMLCYKVMSLRSRLRKSLSEVNDLKKLVDEADHRRTEAETIVLVVRAEKDSL